MSVKKRVASVFLSVPVSVSRGLKCIWVKSVLLNSVKSLCSWRHPNATVCVWRPRFLVHVLKRWYAACQLQHLLQHVHSLGKWQLISIKPLLMRFILEIACLPVWNFQEGVDWEIKVYGVTVLTLCCAALVGSHGSQNRDRGSSTSVSDTRERPVGQCQSQ